VVPMGGLAYQRNRAMSELSARIVRGCRYSDNCIGGGGVASNANTSEYTAGANKSARR
jgi:hypothetical protein